MEGFTIIDGVVALVIVLSALLAYSRGVVREVMAIVGWVAVSSDLIQDQSPAIVAVMSACHLPPPLVPDCQVWLMSLMN